MGFPGGSVVKNLLANKTQVLSLGWEDPLEKGMTTHSSILAWKIPWAEEPGGLQSVRVAKSQTQLNWLSMHILSVYAYVCVCVYVYVKSF